MEIPLLKDILIIFGLSMAVLFICLRLKIPTIIGFLITGILAGPNGLGLITAEQEVTIMAEIGVVMLLFTIGIEFSLRDLVRIRRVVLMGGALQVLLTLAAVLLVSRHFGYGLNESLFNGFLISLSSTAIVLKLMQDRAEMDSPHGQTALGVLIFQDIIIVPMILLTPLLAGKAGGGGPSLLLLLAKGFGIIVLVIISSRWIVPGILYQVARTRSRELFLLSIIVICLGVAWLTHEIQLSLALGAFLAGLVISDSEYSHQALGNVLPFKDLFLSFFFVSIGMLLDIHILFQKPVIVLLLTFGVIGVKSLLGTASVILLGLPLRTAAITGLAISQVGEFSFILAGEGLKYELLGGETFQLFLAVSVLTMIAAPFIMMAGPHIGQWMTNRPLPRRLKAGLYPISALEENRREQLKDHTIIVGYGIVGRNVARAARFAGVPYVVIEMNPKTVRIEKKKDEPIHYGDATQEAVLEHAVIKLARIMVLSAPDPVAIRRMTTLARRLNPNIHIIARTRFIQAMEPLYKLGANEVIPEEFETSVEIFSRVLDRYLIPRDEIHRLVSEVRSDGYGMLRSLFLKPADFCDLASYIPDMQIHTIRVNDFSLLRGKTLSEIGLRKDYGATLLAIRRGENMISNPSGDTELKEEDILLLLGPAEKLAVMTQLFSPPEN